jgi:hypothetical protein
VIPALILVGLVFGRWWRIVIPLAAVGWPAVLIGTGVDSGLAFALGAAGLAIANVVVGVLVHQALWLLVRGITAPNRGPVGASRSWPRE